MASLNKVLLVGNLTRDPELRFLSDQTPVAELRLAVSEKFKNRNGELVESVCYVDVVVWRRQAETCKEYLRKGSPVLIEGRLQLDEWTTKEGEKRNKIRVRADRVQFLGSPRDGAAPETGAGRSASGGPPVFDDGVASDANDAPGPAPSPMQMNNVADDDNLPF